MTPEEAAASIRPITRNIADHIELRLRTAEDHIKAERFAEAESLFLEAGLVVRHLYDLRQELLNSIIVSARDAYALLHSL